MRCKKLFSLLACGPKKKKKQTLLSFSFFSLLVDYIYIDLFFSPSPVVEACLGAFSEFPYCALLYVFLPHLFLFLTFFVYIYLN